MKSRVCCLFTLLSCFCVTAQEKTLKDYEGTWMSAPFMEIMEDAFEEQVEDIVNGEHPGIDQVPRSKAEEALASALKMAGWIHEHFDMRFGFTIALPDKLTVIVELNGEKQEVEYPTEFELTTKEIICRYEDGPSLLIIEGDFLKTRNDDKNAYPKFIKLIRQPASN